MDHTTDLNDDMADDGATKTQPEPNRRHPRQFGLRGLFLATSLVGIFCGLLAAKWYLGLYLYVAGLAFAAMIAGCCQQSETRKTGRRVLTVAVLYGIINLVFFLCIVSSDPFSIFNPGYMFTTIIFFPGAAGVAATFFCFAERKMHLLSLLGFWLWMAIVAFTNFFVIAMASASV